MTPRTLPLTLADLECVVDGVVIAEAKMVEELSIPMQVQRFHLLYRTNLIRLVRS